MPTPSRPRLRWLLGWVLALVLGGLSLLLNHRYLAVDETLAWDDASRYLRLLSRWDLALDGAALPGDAHSPLLFLLGVVNQDLLGPGLDAALFTTAVFAAVMVVGCSRLGMAAAGFWGALLVPLVVAAAPVVGTYSRTFLLDVPGAAWLPWVLLYAATSDGFRRPRQTLLMAVALGLLALSKYQFLFWVLPILLAPFLLMVVRSPASLLGLLLAAPSAGFVLHRLFLRSQESAIGSPPPLGPALWQYGPVIGGGLVLLAVVAGLLRWRASERWSTRLQPGLNLGAGVLLCLALSAPWLYLAAPSIAEHSAEVTGRQWQGLEAQLAAARRVMTWSWPEAFTLLAVAAGLWGLDLALTRSRLGQLAGLRRLRASSPARLLLPLALVLSAALGTWVTARELPINPRYYLPLCVFAGIFIGSSAARLPILRWLLGLPLAAACLLQLLHWELGAPFEPLTRYGVDVGLAEAARDGSLPAPLYAASRRPDPGGPAGAVERMFAEAAATLPPAPRHTPGCRKVAVVSGVPTEPIAISSLAYLQGFKECQVFDAGPPQDIASVNLRTSGRQGPVLPEAVVLVALPELQRAQVVAGLQTGSGLSMQLVEDETLPGGEVVALYQ